MGSSCYHREMNLIGGWMRWWLLRVHFQYCVMAHVSSTWFWAKESCLCMQYKASFNLFDLNNVAVRRSASTCSFVLVGRKNVNLSDESPSSCRGSEPKRILRTGNNDHKYLMFCLELSKSVCLSTDTTAKWHDTMMVCTQTMVTVYHIIICKGFCATREFVQKESRQLLTFQHLSCASHHVQHLPLKTHANPEHGYQFSTGCLASWPQETCTKLSWDACQTAKEQISGAGRSKCSNFSKRSCIKVVKIESRSVKLFI